MDKSTPNSVKAWRWVFIMLEVIVLIPIVATPFISHFTSKQLDTLPGVLVVPFAALYLGEFLFLLIVSPFFLR
jgi:hypothetical protein